MPTKGRVIMDGVDVSELSESERTRLRNQRIGFVFQFFNLMPELSVVENVMLPGMIRGTDGETLYSDAIHLLRKAGLEGQTKQGAMQLSGGQMQRVAITRALINQPSIVLADEPTGNLDSANADEVVELMHNLNLTNRQTFLVVTHDPGIFGSVDKTIRIKDGRVERIST